MAGERKTPSREGIFLGFDLRKHRVTQGDQSDLAAPV
jgi:hypothetical protein